MKKSRKQILSDIINDRGIMGTILVFSIGPIISIFVLLGWCLKEIGGFLMKAQYIDYR